MQVPVVQLPGGDAPLKLFEFVNRVQEDRRAISAIDTALRDAVVGGVGAVHVALDEDADAADFRVRRVEMFDREF